MKAMTLLLAYSLSGDTKILIYVFHVVDGLIDEGLINLQLSLH
jgi:hypothetical protein